MNINPIQNNISMQGVKPDNSWNRLKKRITQKVLDTLPEHTTKESARKLDRWEKYDRWMSKPAENRAIMGVTALMTQPFIDYNNKKVDKDTRKIAFINRCAVIIAGMTVGIFVVRGPIYKVVEKMTNISGKGKWSKFLLPKKYLEEITNNEKYLENYRSTLSTGLALGTMGITNFALDAPATIWLTNRMQEEFSQKDKELEAGNV